VKKRIQKTQSPIWGGGTVAEVKGTYRSSMFGFFFNFASWAAEIRFQRNLFEENFLVKI
jgi:hypothetical protein